MPGGTSNERNVHLAARQPQHGDCMSEVANELLDNIFKKKHLAVAYISNTTSRELVSLEILR